MTCISHRVITVGSNSWTRATITADVFCCPRLFTILRFLMPIATQQFYDPIPHNRKISLNLAASLRWQAYVGSKYELAAERQQTIRASIDYYSTDVYKTPHVCIRPVMQADNDRRAVIRQQ